MKCTLTGNCDLTGYVIESQHCDKNGQPLADFQPITTCPASQCQYHVTELTEKEFYKFRVRAVNPAGEGESGCLAEPVQARAPYGSAT